MLKVISRFTLGLSLSFLGLYLIGIWGKSPWLLALAVSLLAVGLFLLIHAARSHSQIAKTEKRSKPENPSIVVETKSVNLLEKNNKILNEWGKTTETRDRLKLLSLSAEANGE